jgi:hypothetical protein
LLALRVPQAVADQRRRRLRLEARRKGRTVAIVLARIRWHIELLVKVWNGHGRITESRSMKPWRIMCEV